MLELSGNGLPPSCAQPVQSETGTALLRASWEAVASSKRTTVELGRSGFEIWLDHTAVTAFITRDGEVQEALGNDGQTPRKIAHYRPLYDSLLSHAPDPILGFDTAASVVELLYSHADAERRLTMQ